MHSIETESLVDGHAGADSVTEAVVGQTGGNSARFTAMEAGLCGILTGDIAHTGRDGAIAASGSVDVLRIAVVDPCDADTLTSIVTAAEAGLIEPVLIGPAARICSVAALCRLDIRPFHLIGVDREAAAGVASVLAQTGKVEAIMLGRMNDGEPPKAPMVLRVR